MSKSRSSTAPQFPTTRLRRLRYHPRVRDLVRETHLAPVDLILPLFVIFLFVIAIIITCINNTIMVVVVVMTISLVIIFNE